MSISEFGTKIRPLAGEGITRHFTQFKSHKVMKYNLSKEQALRIGIAYSEANAFFTYMVYAKHQYCKFSNYDNRLTLTFFKDDLEGIEEIKQIAKSFLSQRWQVYSEQSKLYDGTINNWVQFEFRFNN